MNIVLTADEHCFGRCVEDSSYRIDSVSISAKHCTISREKAVDGQLDPKMPVPVFIKDTRFVCTGVVCMSYVSVILCTFFIFFSPPFSLLIFSSFAAPMEHISIGKG